MVCDISLIIQVQKSIGTHRRHILVAATYLIFLGMSELLPTPPRNINCHQCSTYAIKRNSHSQKFYLLDTQEISFENAYSSFTYILDHRTIFLCLAVHRSLHQRCLDKRVSDNEQCYQQGCTTVRPNHIQICQYQVLSLPGA